MRKSIVSNERITVYVKNPADIPQVMAGIKRHLDGIEYVGRDKTVGFVCEFCGSIWSETSEKYNGGCCAKDEENALEDR